MVHPGLPAGHARARLRQDRQHRLALGPAGAPGDRPAYPASKGAVLGLTVSLAHNLGADGICVNAINPGYIRTEIHDAFSEEQLATLAADVPLHRGGIKGGGLPIDIANAALFLLSAESDYITGEFLSVNGGSRTGS